MSKFKNHFMNRLRMWQEFLRTLPALDPETTAEEYRNKLMDHFENTFDDPVDTAEVALSLLLWDIFREAGRAYEARVSDVEILEELDRIAPNWRDGYLTPKEKRAIKELLGSDRLRERSDKEVEKDIEHWLGQMREIGKEYPSSMGLPSWQRRTERKGLPVPQEIAAALGGRALPGEGDDLS